MTVISKLHVLRKLISQFSDVGKRIKTQRIEINKHQGVCWGAGAESMNRCKSLMEFYRKNWGWTENIKTYPLSLKHLYINRSSRL